MSSSQPVSITSRPVEVRAAAALTAVAAWTIVVPYLGRLLGLIVPVAARVEVVDHVIPGALTVAAGLYLSRAARRGPLSSDRLALLASGVGFLAGFWVVVTHVPLIGDAATSDQPWDAAIWHSIAGLPMLILAFWLLLRSTQER
jgi:hypothetical protein